MTSVTVTVDGGEIVVLTDSPPPPGSTSLPLLGGGLLRTDPADPATVIEVRVDDVEAAASAIADLCGADVLQRVREVDADSSASGSRSPLELTTSARGSAVLRLALAQWCHDWTPLPVPWWATRLDLGSAAWRAGDVLTAAHVFTTESDRVSRLAESLARSLAPPAVHREMSLTLSDAAAAVGSSHPDARRWLELADRLRDRAGAEDDAPLAPPQPRRAVASAGGEVVVSSVDWECVPPRVLATDDDTVTVTESGGHLVVRVAPHPCLDPDRGAGLVATAHVDGELVATRPLLWQPGEDAFLAELPDEGHGTGVTVGVCHVSALRPPPGLQAARSLRAHREAVRALAVARREQAREAVWSTAQVGDVELAARAAVVAAEDADDPAAAAALQSWVDAWSPSSPGLVGSPFLHEVLMVSRDDLFDLQ